MMAEKSTLRTLFVDIYQNRLALSIVNQVVSILKKDRLRVFLDYCYLSKATRLNFLHDLCYILLHNFFFFFFFFVTSF